MDYPFVSTLPLTLAQSGEIGAAPSTPSGAGTHQPGAPVAPGTAPAANQSSPLGLIWPIIAVFVVFMVMSSMTQRKERRKRAELMSGIKRGDRVQTVGGIIGTVTDLESEELTLKVDDQSNTRIRFARSAIQQVLEPRGRGGAAGAAAVVENKPKGQSSVSV